MMRKNQINLSALNTADMLKYIKVIFQGPVVFFLSGGGGGGGGERHCERKLFYPRKQRK